MLTCKRLHPISPSQTMMGRYPRACCPNHFFFKGRARPPGAPSFSRKFRRVRRPRLTQRSGCRNLGRTPPYPGKNRAKGTFHKSVAGRFDVSVRCRELSNFPEKTVVYRVDRLPRSGKLPTMGEVTVLPRLPLGRPKCQQTGDDLY
jgi:hypothetical protein